MRIYFIRHGAPNYEQNKLTKRGHFEAEEVANFLKNYNIKRIICSDSNRAIETAQHLADKINIKIEQYHSLNEDFGATFFAMTENGGFKWKFFSDKYQNLMIKHQYNDLWFKEKEFQEALFSEGYLTISEELDKILLDLNVKHDREKKEYYAIGEVPETVAIFAHGGIGMSVTPSLMDENFLYSCLTKQHIDVCAFNEFVIDLEKTHRIKMVRYNEVVYDPKKDLTIPLEV